jgi:hypothetical protein
MPYLRYLCLFAYSGVQYILCLSSCGVPNVVSFSGLSIFDCPFVFSLSFIYTRTNFSTSCRVCFTILDLNILIISSTETEFT